MPEAGKNIEPPSWHDKNCPCVHPLDTLGCTCGGESTLTEGDRYA